MIHFHLYVLLAAALYLVECVLPVPMGGWLFLSLFKRFSLTRGPALGFRNPYPQGFAYRFSPPGEQLSPGTSLNLDEAQNRWEQYQEKTRSLLWFSRGLLAVVLTAILLWEIRGGFGLAWGILILSFLFLHFSLVQFFWSAHKALYPSQRGARWRGTLLCLFSPWQTSRAADLLGENLFQGFHPFVIGKLLLEEEDQNLFFRRWLLELKYPAVFSRDKMETRILLNKNRAEELKTLTLWLERVGLRYQASLPSPTPSRPSQKSYCPRCETEYTLEKGACHDCGRDLIPY